MKKILKKYYYIFICFIVLFIYLIVIQVFGYKDIGEKPVIEFSEPIIVLSVHDDESKLFQSLKAYDKEDGDLNDEVYIDSISAFDGDGNSVVTYAVFDSDHHVTKQYRGIHYYDYQHPTFYFNGPLIGNSVSTSTINNLIGATSLVDGDISDKVSITNVTNLSENVVYIKATVRDSTGTIESRDFVYNYDRTSYGININLDKYLVYVKQGSTFDFRNNIVSVLSKTDYEYSKFSVAIKNNVDFNKPGIYEVEYSISSYGNTGFTKCIVIVE